VRVLMITPEVTPFAQTGGLGEVLSALPGELAELGVEVDVFMPKYRGIDCDKYGLKETGLKINVDINARTVPAALWEFGDKRGVRYLFVKCDEYFDREYLYGTPEADYEDNAERFVFLCRSAIEMGLAASTHYDVVHSHDWQASLAPVYLRTLYAGEQLLETSASVMTIHNLGYQGIFWHLDMPLVGVGWEFFTPKHMEFHGKLNFLKSGIVFADEVNTVSPGYRDEILTPEFGFGLEGILQEKGPHLTGILNGVDYKTWNPETDPLIAANFTSEDFTGKALCKTDLQRISHLPIRRDVPVIGMVSRLSDQKGIDILGGAIPSLMEHDLQLVLLGTGDARYQVSFREFAERYPDKIGVFLNYDYGLAHKIFAGADVLLVPSRYEPCGINQLYALKYGTVPIVRATGGLTDTVEEFDSEKDSGTGFKFKQPAPLALEETLFKALDLFIERPGTWERLMVRGMKRDFSWKRSAMEYVRLYEQAIADRKSFLDGAGPR
jgi:starch synthase